MSYSLQIFMDGRWLHLMGVDEENPDRAAQYCDRALMNFKVNARVVGDDDEVVYERFYNRQDDPDARLQDEWDSWCESDEDPTEICWKKLGF